jgi:hypothetical protein
MRARLVVTVSVVAVVGAVFGLTSRAAGSAQTIPGQTNCGDMAGPVWHLIPVNEKRGATGSHYSVSATNMACAKARALALKMTHLRSPGKGLNSSILPGYTCVMPPANQPLTIGGCVAGRVLLPTPGSTGFNWHQCQYVQGTGAHPTCRWTYFTR